MKYQSKQKCVHLLLNTRHTIQHVFIIFLTLGYSSNLGLLIVFDLELLGQIKMIS
jgi:hypothetical protein